MKEILHKLSITLFFFYIASVYICSFLIELNFISLAIFTMFFGSTFFYIALRGYVIIPKAIYFHIGFLYIVILSCYWIMQNYTASQRIGTTFLLLLLSLTIINVVVDEKVFNYSIKMLFFAGIAMCVYSLIFYGYAGTMEALTEEQSVRLGGEINEENIFGMICALTSVIGLYFVFFEKKKVYIFMTAIPIIYTLASGSRMALLMIAAAVVILIALKKGKNFFSTVLIWGLSIAAIIIVLNFLEKSNIFMFKRFEMFFNMLKESSYYDIVDNSSITRLDMMKHGLKWFFNKPILGYGTDQYAILYFQNFGQYRHSHSNIIEVLVNHGIIGFMIYYGIYVYITYYIIKAVKNKLPYSACMLMLMGALAISNIFFVMLYLKITYILLGIMMAYVFLNKSKLKELPATQKG